MKQGFEIVHQVHDAFRGLAGKLHRITGKSETWWRSHGYEPRTVNPLSNGNNSDVADYIAYCELLQAAEPGAGRMLSNRIHGELEMRFSEADFLDKDHGSLVEEVFDENCDVEKWLASKNFATATVAELSMFEDECDEAVERILEAKAKARATKRRMQITQKVKPIKEAA